MIIIPKRLGVAKMFYFPANFKKTGGYVTMYLVNTETKETRNYNFYDQRQENPRYYGMFVYTSGPSLDEGTYEYTITGVDGNDRGLLRITPEWVQDKTYYEKETYKYYKD